MHARNSQTIDVRNNGVIAARSGWLGITLLFLAACGGGGPAVPPPVANSAPTISGLAEPSVRAGEGYSFVPSASDADGDALTFQIENTPFWATFDSVTGELAGLPLATGIGSYSAFISFDGDDQSVSFNVLSPAEAIAGAADLVADGLLGGGE